MIDDQQASSCLRDSCAGAWLSQQEQEAGR